MDTIWALQGFIIDNLLKCSHGAHIGPTGAKIKVDVPILDLYESFNGSYVPKYKIPAQRPYKTHKANFRCT